MAHDDGAGFFNFDFGSGSPSSGCGSGMDYFSARRTRTVNFAAAAYRFYVTGDDGLNSARPQTVEVKRSTDTSSECRKKNISQQKISDMFLLFFGVIVGSTNAFGRIFILTA